MFVDRYIQLHPLAYIVKLKIEMSMAKLITKITREKTNIELTSTNATRDRLGNNKTFDAELERGEGKLTIHAQQEIAVESRSIEDPDGSMCSDGVVGRIHGRDDDDRPLNKGNQGVWDGRTGHSTSVETTDPRQRF